MFLRSYIDFRLNVYLAYSIPSIYQFSSFPRHPYHAHFLLFISLNCLRLSLYRLCTIALHYIVFFRIFFFLVFIMSSNQPVVFWGSLPLSINLFCFASLKVLECLCLHLKRLRIYSVISKILSQSSTRSSILALHILFISDHNLTTCRGMPLTSNNTNPLPTVKSAFKGGHDRALNASIIVCTFHS